MDLNNLLTEYLEPESKYQLGTYHPSLSRFTRDIYYFITPSYPVLTSITSVSRISPISPTIALRQFFSPF